MCQTRKFNLGTHSLYFGVYYVCFSRNRVYSFHQNLKGIYDPQERISTLLHQQVIYVKASKFPSINSIYVLSKKKEVTFICSPLDSGLGPSFGQQMVVERSDLQRPGSTYCPLGQNTLRQPHRPVIPVTLASETESLPAGTGRSPARRTPA